MGKERSMPIVGGSSLLVIFTVLCLTVFAMLSLITAQSDARLSDAAARSVEKYNAADCAAEAVLARLRAGEVPDDVVQHGSVYTYRCEIDTDQYLVVSVELDGADYHILRWQTTSDVLWVPDDNITVWDGEF